MRAAGAVKDGAGPEIDRCALRTDSSVRRCGKCTAVPCLPPILNDDPNYEQFSYLCQASTRVAASTQAVIIVFRSRSARKRALAKTGTLVG